MKRTDTTSIRAGREKILSAAKLTNGEARCLVSNYYLAQEQRKRADLQLRHLGDRDDPISMLNYFGDAQASIEEDLKRALKQFAAASPVGLWALAQGGVGEVIAAGLLALVDVERAPTAGAIWRFAGLDPTAKWLSRDAANALVNQQVGRNAQPTDADVQALCLQTNKKFETVLRFATTDPEGNPVPLTKATLARALARRPYNPNLKQVCWHAGQCFKRVSGDPRALYGQIYRSRKALLVAKNEAGAFADRAKTFITNSTDVRKLLGLGRLPAGNLDQQACNLATKIFLSHFHVVAYWHRFHTAPPRPFAIAVLGHAHEVRVPNLDLFPGLAQAYYGGVEDPVAAE